MGELCRNGWVQVFISVVHITRKVIVKLKSQTIALKTFCAVLLGIIHANGMSYFHKLSFPIIDRPIDLPARVHFFIVYGHNPLIPLDLAPLSATGHFSAEGEERLDQIKANHQQVQEQIVNNNVVYQR